MKRIYFQQHDSMGAFPDGRVKLDVLFKDSEGNRYVWTPDWQKGTRQFFLEAYRIESLNVPGGSEREKFKKTAEQVLEGERRQKTQTNFELLVTKLGEQLKWDITLKEIERTATALFEFPISHHPHPAITSSRSQTIYDWIMTVAERPLLTEEAKLQLIRAFVGELTNADNPARGLLDDL